METPELMSYVDLPLEARNLMRALAGAPAQEYVQHLLDVGLTRAWAQPLSTLADARAGFLEPGQCLQAALGHYAFLRRGRDRQELAHLARESIAEAQLASDIPLVERRDGSSVWKCFEARCQSAGRKPLPELNYGPVAGLVELAQEIYQQDGVGSIAQWIGDAVVRTGRLEAEFERIVDIRGVGPKFASVFLRDVVFVLDVEDTIAPVDRIYLQPIDKWIRMSAPLILDSDQQHSAAGSEDTPDAGNEGRPDWVLAGKLAKYARLAGVQGTRLNMGASWLGSREGKSPHAFLQHLRRLRSG